MYTQLYGPHLLLCKKGENVPRSGNRWIGRRDIAMESRTFGMLNFATEVKNTYFIFPGLCTILYLQQTCSIVHQLLAKVVSKELIGEFE